MKTWDSDLDDPLFHSKMDAAWNQTNQSADMPEQIKPLTDKSIMWFGKHRGKSLEQIPDDYFYWLYGQSNLDPRMKAYIDEYLPGAKVANKKY